ncbi:BON domain-containing protein [Paraburkholderia sp. BCC1886]|uniref:BON domain-containing protein n=1 Tax=Paraburkholderia sp. BCC1886 TaxID=2562670 RepID=UPI0011834248|nr:BON domain-containing protein [Paraburkholderia sp. BCC1886]
MKAIRIAGAVLLMAACIDGYAQGPGTAAPASVMASASAAASPASGAVTDRQLAASVRKALHAAHRHGLKSTFIRVRANGGVVTLTGVVADNSQIGLATSVAQGVPGVTSVVNKLTLRSVAGMKGSE